MNRNARKRKVFEMLRTLLLCTFFLRTSIQSSVGTKYSHHNQIPENLGCRQQLQNEIVEPSSCETICRRTSNDSLVSCELRLLVILPNQPWMYEASLPKVMPVLELAKTAIKQQGLLPQYLDIKFIPHDDCCEPSLATISAMDGLYGDDCAHAILGPACDYSTGNYVIYFIYIRGLNAPLAIHLL